ncbi:MAG: preprotein translocase subunit SecA [Alphaproteobacteria bacterium]|nr:preprotein translocase subunit SecA [Alphaproteobacteria bacterium]
MIFNKLFGSANDRYLRRFKKTINKINELEATYELLSDEQLRDKTQEYKTRIQNGEALESILPEAFASVREGAKRTLGLRPFDVQLLGGIILNNGHIAEMRTGEGKTLVATLPVYLNALTGKGVHVVTVNDYLAKRDSEWMGQIYRFLGLSVGCIVSGMKTEERRAAYNADITYATNNELGFDYLRDNMCFELKDMVQRPFNYAIVDEVDSILIDEARTPLIISGPAEDSSERYVTVNKLMTTIRPEHYEKDEKNRSATLTELGTEYVEQMLQEQGLIQGGLYETQNIAFVHHVDQALRAHALFTRDKDYIVKDGQVIIIDEFTGRMMNGRRYSDGLHQAIEAKEGVQIHAENQTLASITFQNYFRMYPKLAGMTGTAMTEAGEFDSIYHLNVIEIPTNKPAQRKDDQDVIYRTVEEKYDAIIEEIKTAHERKQPILVGTTSIEKSEVLAELLRQRTDIQFNVLNARHHEKEAQIIAQAGVPGAVTIATNMAGRGTDIQLGGNFEMRLAEELAKNPDANVEELTTQIKSEIAQNKEIALAAGGLYVLGSERHESRRIDNQLRGRSGRQGDPGQSRFYISLEDDLMRIFGADRTQNLLKRLGMEKGQAVVHSWISKAIAVAQQKVEAHHFDIRKNLLKFDDVMNDQRKVIYEQRKELMIATDVSDTIKEMRDDCIADMIYGIAPSKSVPENWDIAMLHQETLKLLGLDMPFSAWVNEPGMTPEIMIERLSEEAQNETERKMNILPSDVRRNFEKGMLIQTIDQSWKEHLQTLDFMKTAIGLRAYGQKNPLNEYKRESFVLFETLLSRVRERITQIMGHMQFQVTQHEPQETYESHPLPQSTAELNSEDMPKRPQPIGANEKIARNAPCPCGSGKKYKHCCGAIKQ